MPSRDEAVQRYVGIGLGRLIEPTRAYSRTKDTGPFSWRKVYKNHGGRVRYLGSCSKVGSDRRGCRLYEPIQWLPKIRLRSSPAP